jgi:hypothetical protein
MTKSALVPSEAASEREFLQKVADWRRRIGRRPRSGWALGRCAVLGVLLATPLPLALLRAPPWAEWIVAGVGVVVAAVVWPGGLFDRARRARPRAVEGWMSDHAWDPSGETRTPLRRYRDSQDARAHALMFPFWLSMQVTLIDAGTLWMGLLALSCVATAAAASGWIRSRSGTAHLSFTRFPYHPNELVVLHFGMAEGGASFERAAFHLHHVVESAHGPLRLRHCAIDTRFTRRLVRPPGELPGPNQHVELVFDVPPGPGTRLSAPLPEYWVLDVFGKTSAGWYTDSFLIPIYERPAA